MNGPVLVVGGDSVLGKSIVSEFVEAGYTLYWTSRRLNGHRQSEQLFLDLSDSRTPPEVLSINPKIVVISAGVTSIKACEENPEYTNQINVNSVVRLGQEFISSGSAVVYISSNAVFDGKISHVPASSEIAALSVYGQQKAEAEKCLLSMDGSVCVVRFSKLSHSLLPLILGWSTSISQEEKIHPFTDAFISPVKTTLAASAVRLAAERQLTGVSQLSASRDISYADAANIVASKCGWPLDLIEPVNSKSQSSVFSFPSHTTMDSARLASAGLRCPEPQAALEDVVSVLKSTAT